MSGALVPLFPGMPGTTEMMVILLIAVLLFGANKIPKLARSTGQAMGEFQKGREEVEQELKEIKESGNDAGSSTTEDPRTSDRSTDDTASERSTSDDAEASSTEEETVDEAEN